MAKEKPVKRVKINKNQSSIGVRKEDKKRFDNILNREGGLAYELFDRMLTKYENN